MRKKIYFGKTVKSSRNKFKNIYSYGFFTRNGGTSDSEFESLNCAFNNKDSKENVLKNRDIVLKQFKNSFLDLITINQVHSTKVVEINQLNKNQKKTADAMITKSKGILLGILTADCAPVIIIGSVYVAIIHVGWKGLLNGILENTIKLLIKKGERKGDLICKVGPHLKWKSFIVKNDFIKKLLKKNKNNSKFLTKINDITYFNFTKYIEFKFNILGITQFSFSNLDTYSNPSLFFSYRYSKKMNINLCGRQISVVGIID